MEKARKGDNAVEALPVAHVLEASRPPPSCHGKPLCLAFKDASMPPKPKTAQGFPLPRVLFTCTLSVIILLLLLTPPSRVHQRPLEVIPCDPQPPFRPRLISPQPSKHPETPPRKSAPANGTLMYTSLYGRQSNQRFALAEIIALALLLDRALMIPDTTYVTQLYDFNAMGGKLGVTFLDKVPSECMSATVYRIGGVFGGLPAPLNFDVAGPSFGSIHPKDSMPAQVDLEPLRSKAGVFFTNDQGIAFGPPDSDFPSLLSFWPLSILHGEAFLLRNVDTLPFPNLVPLLEQMGAGNQCLVIDISFNRLDWRQHQSLFTRVWSAMVPIPPYLAAAALFHQTSPLAGRPFTAVHLRLKEFCREGEGGHACECTPGRVEEALQQMKASHACAAGRGVAFVLSDLPDSPSFQVVKRHFHTVVVLSTPAFEELKREMARPDLVRDVVEQEIAARGGACFLASSSSTFSGVVRIRRMVISGAPTHEQEFVYE